MIPSTPTRRGPKPKHPPGTTPAQRKAISRAARGTLTVELPAPAVADLDAIAARDGDTSRSAVVVRLARVAASRG